MGISTQTEKLEYAVYALHDDSCPLNDLPKEVHDRECATGKRGKYVLAARFAYMLEAIDYCFLLNGRGVNCQLRKPKLPVGSEWSDYSLATSPIRAKIVETRVEGR